ncbi:lysylphosphatidylglycerol synthase domain-containing protein [Rhizobium sp. BK602]|uniref:lysylphosphatidylglycerol synthase domain-containing protein n=1 Tax=Rhizobium sp. BK602 TaxID=2586986 RepID=UPI00160CAFFD|nr:lysylphosphatidylglycerol synthase domain-containing protein [Rhizobium sp. BK602]MBB3612398.1 hypothetical protein [Rhizobium sp. BK602]
MLEAASANRLKSYAHAAGLILSLVAIAVVGLAAYRSFDGLRQSLSSPLFLSAVAGAVVIYAALLQLIGLAWHRLLSSVDGPSLGLLQALAICGRTQIYKYLPSNVLHMVGRYGFAKKAGASNKALAFAQVGELLTIVLAASMLATVLARPILVQALAAHGFDHRTLVDIAAAAGMILLVIATVLVVRFRIVAIGYRTLGALVLAVITYLLFFTGCGLLLAGLCKSLGGSVGLIDIIGIGTTAWFLGFVVPGAPGGLGVREAVLIAGLTTTGLPMAEATAAALGYRIVTMLGDVVVATTFMFLNSEDS